MKSPIAISFFSGAMGLDLGMEAAGFLVRSVCEVDPACRKTIRRNRPLLPLLGDVNELTAQMVRQEAGLAINDDIDVVYGGPPCQAFSTAGKRKGFNDDRGNVFLNYLQLAIDLRPKFLVIENVRGLLSCPMSHRPHHLRGHGFPELACDEKPGGALNFVLNRLRSSGYSASFNLYNSANFGVPQIRERVVIVASRDGVEPPYLVPTHSDVHKEHLPWRTFRAAVCGIKQHTHLEFPEKRLKYYRMLKAGQNWRDLPSSVQQEALGGAFNAGGGKTGFFRRLAWDEPAPTLVTHPAMPATDLAHPVENRPLSIEEYKRLQQFPDDWMLEGKLVDQYRQVGNAVPVGLGKAIGMLIVALLRGEQVPQSDDFKYSRYKNSNDVDWQREFKKQLAKASNPQLSLF